jgi:hypothetical protein
MSRELVLGLTLGAFVVGLCLGAWLALSTAEGYQVEALPDTPQSLPAAWRVA